MPLWIDVTVPLHESVAVWPGNPSFNIQRHRMVGFGSLTNDSIITMDVHTGTHVEGLLHIESDAEEPSNWPVDALVMDVIVAYAPDVQVIGPEVIPELLKKSQGILFKTSNSDRNLWDETSFRPDYCALNELAARQMSSNPNLKAVGIDYLSIQSPFHSIDVHKYLLESSIAVIEGLDLRKVAPGPYHMICLPLIIVGAEAVPCRVMLSSMEKEERDKAESESNVQQSP